MKKAIVSLFFLVLATSIGVAQQRPPVIGRKLPNPGKERIEVRFALGQKAVTCKHFRLTAKIDNRIIMKGDFEKGFRVPSEARALPRNDVLDLEFKCGNHRWHFTKVPETVFQSSWWWVGTDYPPFQETFQGWAKFEDAAWIRYLIVDPQGFFVERHCPTKLKDKRPGPCYDE